MKNIHILALLFLLVIAAYITGGYAAVTEAYGFEPEQVLASADGSGAVCVSGVIEKAPDSITAYYGSKFEGECDIKQIDGSLTVVKGVYLGRSIQIAIRDSGDGISRVTAGTPLITTGY